MVDSVQTCVTDETPTAAGSVATLRAVADRLMQLAKGANVAMLLAGHVTAAVACGARCGAAGCARRALLPHRAVGPFAMAAWSVVQCPARVM